MNIFSKMYKKNDKNDRESNVIEMNRQKTSSESKIDRSKFKKRIRAHRMKIFSVGAFVFIAIFVIILVLYISYQKKVYSDYEVNKSVDCQRIEGSTIISFDDKFLTYSADGIHCTNSKGEDTWSVPFEMQTPMLDMNGEYVACADLNGRTVYVFNEDGEMGEINVGHPIKQIAISRDGVVAVISDDDDITPIDIYYYDGSKIASFRTTMSKSGYPLALCISDNSKLLAVSYVYMDNGKVTTKLAFFNFGDVGQNETDNLVSGYDYEDSVVPVVKFLDNKSAVAVADTKLLFYSGKERPTQSECIDINEEIQSVFYGDEKVGLLFSDTSGKGKYRLDTYSSKGKKLSSIYITQDFSDIFYANGVVVIYNSTSAEIYKTNGNVKYKGDFDESVALMIPTSKMTRYTIVTADAIKSIELK